MVALKSRMILCNVAGAIGVVSFHSCRSPSAQLIDELSDPYYQDVPWSYSLNAHHDVHHLIELAGGPETFVARLEKFFEPGVFKGNEAFGNTIYNPGNQPA
jgi:putative alpha-1,2-mannosidase